MYILFMYYATVMRKMYTFIWLYKHCEEVRVFWFEISNNLLSLLIARHQRTPNRLCFHTTANPQNKSQSVSLVRCHTCRHCHGCELWELTQMKLPQKTTKALSTLTVFSRNKLELIGFIRLCEQQFKAKGLSSCEKAFTRSLPFLGYSEAFHVQNII